MTICEALCLDGTACLVDKNPVLMSRSDSGILDDVALFAVFLCGSLAPSFPSVAFATGSSSRPLRQRRSRLSQRLPRCRSTVRAPFFLSVSLSCNTKSDKKGRARWFAISKEETPQSVHPITSKGIEKHEKDHSRYSTEIRLLGSSVFRGPFYSSLLGLSLLPFSRTSSSRHFSFVFFRTKSSRFACGG